jgi:hypothetical protein
MTSIFRHGSTPQGTACKLQVIHCSVKHLLTLISTYISTSTAPSSLKCYPFLTSRPRVLLFWPQQARVWTPIFLRVFNNNRISIIISCALTQSCCAFYLHTVALCFAPFITRFARNPCRFVGRRYFRKSFPRILSLYKSPYCTNFKSRVHTFQERILSRPFPGDASCTETPHQTGTNMFSAFK